MTWNPSQTKSPQMSPNYNSKMTSTMCLGKNSVYVFVCLCRFPPLRWSFGRVWMPNWRIRTWGFVWFFKTREYPDMKLEQMKFMIMISNHGVLWWYMSLCLLNSIYQYYQCIKYKCLIVFPRNAPNSCWSSKNWLLSGSWPAVNPNSFSDICQYIVFQYICSYGLNKVM